MVVLPTKLLGVAFTKKYSHLSNSHGGWNKRGGGKKVAKSINVEVGINVEWRVEKM